MVGNASELTCRLLCLEKKIVLPLMHVSGTVLPSIRSANLYSEYCSPLKVITKISELHSTRSYKGGHIPVLAGHLAINFGGGNDGVPKFISSCCGGST